MDAATGRFSRTTAAGHLIGNDGTSTGFDDSQADDVGEPLSPIDSRGESSRRSEGSRKRPRGAEEINKMIIKSSKMLRNALIDAVDTSANRKTSETDSVMAALSR